MTNNDHQSILIHADGTIQVHRARGQTVRFGNKTFRLAEQAYNDTMLGPFVYTECSTPTEAQVDNVIPFRPRRNDILRNQELQYAN